MLNCIVWNATVFNIEITLMLNWIVWNGTILTFKCAIKLNQPTNQPTNQTIEVSISIVFVYTLLNVKTVLFQTIQFSVSTQFSSIWPINRTLSGATTSGQSGPWSDGITGVLRFL